MKFSCARCGYIYLESPNLDVPFLPKDHIPCPECGASSISGEVAVEETFSMHDAYSLKAKDEKGVFLKMKGGASQSEDGTFAQVEQIVDKRDRTYKKKVTLADGTVVKDVEGTLDDQTLHGPQKK